MAIRARWESCMLPAHPKCAQQPPSSPIQCTHRLRETRRSASRTHWLHQIREPCRYLPLCAVRSCDWPRPIPRNHLQLCPLRSRQIRIAGFSGSVNVRVEVTSSQSHARRFSVLFDEIDRSSPSIRGTSGWTKSSKQSSQERHHAPLLLRFIERLLVRDPRTIFSLQLLAHLLRLRGRREEDCRRESCGSLRRSSRAPSAPR